MTTEKQIDGIDLAVLSSFRNKHYAESFSLELGIVANAINNVIPILVSVKNDDYRKQSVGRNITKNHPVDEFICEKCGAIFRDCQLIVIDEDDGDEYNYEFAFKFCPKCGMKVKGGAE